MVGARDSRTHLLAEFLEGDSVAALVRDKDGRNVGWVTMDGVTRILMGEGGEFLLENRFRPLILQEFPSTGHTREGTLFPSSMKLSKRGEYGMRTLINLGIAREVGREVLSASDLSSEDNLPLKFVEQILADFRHAGIIATKRGKFGGYYLHKDPAEIKMGDMVRLLDGMLAPIPCASESFYQPCTCADEDHCGLRMLMIDVRNAVSNILDRYTLADVVEVTLRKMRRDKTPIPFAPVNTQDGAGKKATMRRPVPEDGFLAILTGAKPRGRPPKKKTAAGK